MDLFLSVYLQKQYLLITLLIDLLILSKWTLLERSLKSLLRSFIVKLLIDNFVIKRLGFIHSNIELQTRARPYVQSNKYTYSCNNNKCSLFTGVWVLHSWTKTKDQCQDYLQKLHFVSTYLEVVAHNLSSDYS